MRRSASASRSSSRRATDAPRGEQTLKSACPPSSTIAGRRHRDRSHRLRPRWRSGRDGRTTGGGRAVLPRRIRGGSRGAIAGGACARDAHRLVFVCGADVGDVRVRVVRRRRRAPSPARSRDGVRHGVRLSARRRRHAAADERSRRGVARGDRRRPSGRWRPDRLQAHHGYARDRRRRSRRLRRRRRGAHARGRRSAARHGGPARARQARDHAVAHRSQRRARAASMSSRRAAIHSANSARPTSAR